MIANYSESIPEIQIKDFAKQSSDILFFTLNELFDSYSSILLKPHRISYYQILMLKDSNGCIHIDSGKYNFKSNSVIAQSKGNVECFEYNSTKDFSKEKVTGYAVLFTEEYLNKYPEDLGWINSLKIFDMSNNHYQLRLSSAEYGELEHILSKLQIELNTKNNYGAEELCLNLVKAYLLLLERIKRTRLNDNLLIKKEHNLLTEFKTKLEENYLLSRSVQYYADQLNITTKKLNQITQENFGMPVKKVIKERILLEVKRLLVYTDQTIREIGFSIGFNDPTNFNKFFKKYVKVTPVEFRKSHKKE